MANVRTFWLEPTDNERLWLRRYSLRDGRECASGYKYHNAMFLIGESPIVWAQEDSRVIAPRDSRMPPVQDPRWPAKCEHCDYTFAPDDEYQLFGRTLYRRADTGEITTIEDAPDGAMWNAYWTSRWQPDGRNLMVKVPGGATWHIDGRASNCDMPEDGQHRCWVRHGEPPLLTVDKNGHTCNAGGGSIQTNNWHGHLVNGEFIPC